MFHHRYSLKKNNEGDYLIPDNAAGTYKEEEQQVYYYYDNKYK